MNPITFKKAMLEAYLAGASNMYCGCYEMQTKANAREWFDNEYGQQESEKCDCCEDDDDGDS
jgi:hypothetical protein